MVKMHVKKFSGKNYEFFFRDREKATAYVAKRIQKTEDYLKKNKVKYIKETTISPSERKDILTTYKGDQEIYIFRKG